MQLWVQILAMAFLVVGASTALAIPVMLYVFDLRHEGWSWEYAALFGAMVGPTDAVAIVAILKSGMCMCACAPPALPPHPPPPPPLLFPHNTSTHTHTHTKLGPRDVATFVAW